VDELAEALRAIRTAWDGATRDGGPACGMDVVERAYRTMQTSWFDELGAQLDLLGHTDGQ
jgi:hypothetical protein